MRFPQAHPPSDRGVILTTMTILGNRAARRHRRTRCAGVGCERWAGPTLAALDAQMARLQARAEALRAAKVAGRPEHNNPFHTEPRSQSFASRQRLVPLDASQLAVDEKTRASMASVVEPCRIAWTAGEPGPVSPVAVAGHHRRLAVERGLDHRPGRHREPGQRRWIGKEVGLPPRRRFDRGGTHGRWRILSNRLWPGLGPSIRRHRAPASHSLRSCRTDEHATVVGGGFLSGCTVADFRSFLSALVLAQPSPWAVCGPR